MTTDPASDPASDPARLDTYDREEWWDICRSIRPDVTREEFEADWKEFQTLKERRARQ